VSERRLKLTSARNLPSSLLPSRVYIYIYIYIYIYKCLCCRIFRCDILAGVPREKIRSDFAEASSPMFPVPEVCDLLLSSRKKEKIKEHRRWRREGRAADQQGEWLKGGREEGRSHLLLHIILVRRTSMKTGAARRREERNVQMPAIE